MAYFVVTYDLVKEKDYNKLINELVRIGSEKIALSVWLVEQDMTAFGMRDHLKNFIDDDDKLVVIEFSKKPSYTRGFVSGGDWIKARFS